MRERDLEKMKKKTNQKSVQIGPNMFKRRKESGKGIKLTIPSNGFLGDCIREKERVCIHISRTVFSSSHFLVSFFFCRLSAILRLSYRFIMMLTDLKSKIVF